MSTQEHSHDEDVRVLHSMGYAQELSRRMGGFQNFAISFSIICILAGGIGTFAVGFGAAGGGSIGIGWIVGSVFALLVATAMGQIASAYPTAGGLYHWASILGGKGLGWGTAWLNLIGLLFVVASVDYGVVLLARDLVLVPMFGISADSFTTTDVTIGVILVTVLQAILNYVGIKATTILTDFSGYLIFLVSVVIIIGLLVGSPVPFDFSRLVNFHNYTGDPGAGTWPPHSSLLFAFILGLLHVCYTITGFDASAHTSEETRDAQRAVGVVRDVPAQAEPQRAVRLELRRDAEPGRRVARWGREEPHHVGELVGHPQAAGVPAQVTGGTGIERLVQDPLDVGLLPADGRQSQPTHRGDRHERRNQRHGLHGGTPSPRRCGDGPQRAGVDYTGIGCMPRCAEAEVPAGRPEARYDAPTGGEAR